MAQRRYNSNDSESHYLESKNSYQSHKYNNTSSAYDYEIEEEEIPVRVVKRSKRVKRGTRQVYITNTDRSARPSILVFAAMAIMTVCFGLCVVSYSMVATQTSKNNKLRTDLKAMQSRTAELSIEVTQSMDLVEIERIARTRLEMSEPQLHQIVHVNVPKENYTVYLMEAEDTAYQKAEISSNKFSAILNFFKKD